MAELLVARWLNNIKKFVYDVFLFLVCFVTLQIMMKGAWWVSFVMECNSSGLMKILHEFYESRFWEEIGKKIFEEWKDEVIKSIFDASWAKEDMTF